MDADEKRELAIRFIEMQLKAAFSDWGFRHSREDSTMNERFLIWDGAQERHVRVAYEALADGITASLKQDVKGVVERLKSGEKDVPIGA